MRDGRTLRFRLLDTIRQYAWERLEQRSAAEDRRRRHAAFFVGLAERAQPEWTRPEYALWLRRVEVEHANMRTALAWTLAAEEVETGLRLGAAL